MSEDKLCRTLANAEVLLLDFDGPVCSLFANYPASRVAAELIDLMRGLPIADIDSSDPLEVLRLAGKFGNSSVTVKVEDALCRAELHAAATAEPTPSSQETIVAARQAGLSVAIVSNNSAAAVERYLKIHQLIQYVSVIVGRPYAQPELMKPHPTPIMKAVHSMESLPSRCVLVGDSLSDIQGARAAGVAVVAYANKPSKMEKFETAEADSLVTDMGELADSLCKLAQKLEY